jgi:hypothetical protein
MVFLDQLKRQIRSLSQYQLHFTSKYAFLMSEELALSETPSTLYKFLLAVEKKRPILIIQYSSAPAKYEESYECTRFP